MSIESTRQITKKGRHRVTNYLYDGLLAKQAENDASFLQRDDCDDISFRAFLELAAQMAHVLVNAGLELDDRVLVQAPKTAEMVALYAATIMAGGVFLPLNSAYTDSEIEYFIGDAEPKIVVCGDENSPTLTNLSKICGAHVLTLNEDGSGSLAQASITQPKTFSVVKRGGDDLAALMYTSGTTGRSKGAMLTHRNLLSNAESLVQLWQITNEDRLIHALPIFHTHGLFVALNTSLYAGACVHFMPAFDLEKIVGAMPKATMLMGVPTFYTRMLGDSDLDSELCKNMRLFISGSAPLLAETHAEFTDRTGHQILERYGMTETNMITSNPYDGKRKAGTVGLPLPGVEVRLTNPDTGEPISQGEIGMIEVRGANVFKGYWRMPEKTRAELREDGFFITGDLGQISDDGYITIVGREKDLIISGGYNVYPSEVEGVLNTVEGVFESAVFGVPDPEFGESVVATIVVVESKTVTEQVLSTVISEKLARFKHPRQYRFVRKLPRNTMGKVQKNLLRDSFDKPLD